MSWRRWFTDTLAKRLFLLLWAALVLSHVAAWGVVQLVLAQREPSPARAAPATREAPPPGQRPGGPPPGPGSGVPQRTPQVPVFPSLPPTPGLPDDGGPPDWPPREQPGGGPGGGGLPFNILLLDYGVRLLVIALAAGLGARWLAAPMRRLSAAARTLGGAIGQPQGLPVLDEHAGSVEVREAARVFNAMARQLQAQFRQRGLMVAAISHDLRTPLTRLRLRLQNMAGLDPAQQQRAVDDVQQMNALIDNVLDVFRDADLTESEALRRTDVAALAQSLVDDLAEQRQDVRFEEGESAVARVRPLALRRALDNLIGNALRYGDRAVVSVRQTDAELRVCIDDAGPGIPPQHLDDVFEPFFRLESSRSQRTGGTGLGLYIARDLVRRQGGTVTLSNRPEGGLRAELVLPRS